MRHCLRIGILVLSLWVAVTQAEIQVQDGYVRGMPPGQATTAAFMRLLNSGSEDVVIDGGATDAAKRVEFHQHVHKDDMMSMRQVPSITVPAGGEFVLEPGHFHLMMIDLLAPLREGDTVTLQLRSGSKEVLSAKLPVRSVLNEHQH